MVTMRADGTHGDGAAERTIRARCAPPCALEEASFLPAAGEHVLRLRFPPLAGGVAVLELSAAAD